MFVLHRNRTTGYNSVTLLRKDFLFVIPSCESFPLLFVHSLDRSGKTKALSRNVIAATVSIPLNYFEWGFELAELLKWFRCPEKRINNG